MVVRNKKPERVSGIVIDGVWAGDICLLRVS